MKAKQTNLYITPKIKHFVKYKDKNQYKEVYNILNLIKFPYKIKLSPGVVVEGAYNKKKTALLVDIKPNKHGTGMIYYWDII